jgi:hypothetical protein
MWTGMRMVRAWSAIERVMAWRIHQVAYVEEGEAAVRVLLRDRDHEAQVGLDHLGLRAVRLAHVGHRLLVDLDQLVGRDALLELDGAQARVDGARVDRGVLLCLRVLRAVQLDLRGLYLLEDGAQLLQVLLVDLQLEEELREVGAQRRLPPAELGQGLLALGLGAGLGLLDPGFLRALLVLLRRLDQLRERAEVRVAALDLLVDHDAVEALLAVQELGPQDSDVSADCGRLEEGLLGLQLGVLDPLGNLDLLLAGQQRHLAHLLEVHPDRVVQDVVLRRPRFLLLGLLLALLVVLDLVGLEDLDLEVLQDGEDVIDLLLVLDRLGQRLVDVVERQVALLLGEADQLADLLVDSSHGDRGVAALGGRLRHLCQGFFDGFGVVAFGLFGFARHEIRWGTWRMQRSADLGQLDRLPELALQIAEFP